MSECSGRRSADAPTPPAASMNYDSKPSAAVHEQLKKRALYSITDKIRILNMMQEHSNRYPTHTVTMQLRALNLTHIGYATTKLWMDTCDEIYAAERLGLGSRYRLSLEERKRVKDELLREKNAPAVGEAVSSSVATASSSSLVVTPHSEVGFDCNTNVYTPDEEDLLGAIIYRSSRTAKTRREAKLQI